MHSQKYNIGTKISASCGQFSVVGRFRCTHVSPFFQIFLKEIQYIVVCTLSTIVFNTEKFASSLFSYAILDIDNDHDDNMMMSMMIVLTAIRSAIKYEIRRVC